MEPSIVSKLSVKGIGCKPVGTKEPTDLCIIGGKADGCKVGEDKTGKIFSALTGSFLAKNLQDGTEFRSGKLFLPSGIQEVIENAVRGLGDDSGGSVKFLFKISSIEAGNPIGYSYRATSLIPTVAETDELGELNALIAAPVEAAPAQIAAPVAAPAKAKK